MASGKKIKKTPSSKWTAFHVPKDSEVLELARELADEISLRSEVEGINVPMYIAVKVALREALTARRSLGKAPEAKDQK